MSKIAILYGHGINCDLETQYVIEKASERLNLSSQIKTERVHTNEFIRKNKRLEDYQMLVIPGGFLHGDDISAGKILANKLKTKLSKELEDFIQSEKLILGICNGFQVLVKYPTLPCREDQKVTLTWNNSGRFIDRWIKVKVNQKSPCIYLKDIDEIYLPIRHAEGRFTGDEEILDTLEKEGQVALKYVRPDGSPAEGEFPWNPNDSIRDIAGICDKSGRIFGLMPHPEAFHSPLNCPNWVRDKTEEEEIKEMGTGLKIFENVVKFIDKKM